MEEAVASLADCQAVCQARPDCTHFRYHTQHYPVEAERQRCFLKGSDTGSRTDINGAISGPKYCREPVGSTELAVVPVESQNGERASERVSG